MKLNYEDVIKEPNDILRTKSEDVPLPLNKEDKDLLQAMLNYVKDSQDDELAEKEGLRPAVGIAAIQLGIPKKMLAIYVDMGDEDHEDIVELALVNPKIVAHSEQVSYLQNGEGCLSVEDIIEGYVPRHARITVKAYDLVSDQEIKLRISGYPAIILQHEIDHLSGIMFHDHINQENPWIEIDGAIII